MQCSEEEKAQERWEEKVYIWSKRKNIGQSLNSELKNFLSCVTLGK